MITLPATAAAKLAVLETAASDANALAQASLSRARTLANSLAESDSEAASAALEIELAKAREQQLARMRTFETENQVVLQIKEWLKRLPVGAVLEVVDGVEPQLHDGESIADAVHRIRNELQKAQSELMRTRGAPLPKSELKARARETVARMARPPVIVSAGGRFDVTWQNNAATFAAWFSPDALIAKLEAEIDAGADDGLSVEARKQREREVGADILDLERQEESLIESADGEVARRVMADPRAILGVRIKAPPANLSLVA